MAYYGPIYLRDLIVLNEPSRSLTSETKGPLLKVPRTNLVSAGDQLFSKLQPLLCNAIPQDVRECSSLDVFKALLKHTSLHWHMNRKD